MTQESQKPPTKIETESSLPFDEALQTNFQKLAQQSFLKCPELRSVVVVFDYNGKFNDFDIKKGLWLANKGTKPDYASVVGSMRQTAAMLELQMTHLQALHALADKELEEKYKRLRALGVQIEQEEKTQGQSDAGLPIRHPDENWERHDGPQEEEKVGQEEAT